MTFSPATLPSSAVELHDDDGQAVATIYARAAGVEIVCAAGYSAEFGFDRRAGADHLSVTIARDGRNQEARR